MREKTIEQKLTKTAKERGGVALKFVSPGFDGMPDRIVLTPKILELLSLRKKNKTQNKR